MCYRRWGGEVRILWFTNTLFPGHTGSPADSLRGGEGWTVALLEKLVGHTDWQIAIVTVSSVKRAVRHSVQGVDFFVVPYSKGSGKFGQARALRHCAAIVREWQPDLVHIHGMERFYGLLTARKLIQTPTVISIQGLLSSYSEWYHYFGNRTIGDIVRMHRWMEPFVLRGALWGLRKYRQGATTEREIIRGNFNFLGRTLWDRAHVMAMNPLSTYYTVGEVLRQPFWDSQWDLEKCRRHRVIFTNARHPRKGPEVLLDVVPLLKPDYPDIQVCIGGNISHRSGYGRYIRRKMRKLDTNVVELGALNAKEMAAELVRSHVFVSPSFIDNSPNALCEAQLVGMPIISTYTGGVPSLVEDGKTGFFFTTGDTPTLAAKLREVFENDDLARQLGSRARETAQQRHAPDRVVGALIQAYEDVLRRSKMK